MNTTEFQELIFQKGDELYREMPWRTDTRPYYVLVSELMLQQTQVDRVIPKFEAFIAAFPDVKALSFAPLSDVLAMWQGLGYNRRAKYLHDAARMIIAEFAGDFPDTVTTLQKLPGVGPNTAGAIMNYAYNEPVAFIETNVRTIYFHHFFPDGEIVSDKELLEVVERTISHEHPREFYWALMDYGSWLKRQGAGRLSQSKHYKKQSPLKGSLREMRGEIIRQLAAGEVSRADIERSYPGDERVVLAVEGLQRDGLIVVNDDRLSLMD